MPQAQIKEIIKRHLPGPGLKDTALRGVQLFHVTEPVPCIPAVYDPTIVAIVGGTKDAVLDGQHHVYDSSHYLLCPMTLPVEAGSPRASPEDPLLGVMIALEPRVMRDLVIEVETASRVRPRPDGTRPQALALARWDSRFADALLRLLELLDDPVDAAVLGPARLRELHYAVLMGEAGHAARRAFGVDNAIARVIDHLSSHLNAPVSVDELAARAGMSRPVFHRRFKEATRMSPIQFVKAMRLNHAAMKIAEGKTVSEAAWQAGFASASQFSREFKRSYGRSPRQWRDEAQMSLRQG
ncbi:AraC-like DNA-binding protein [Albidovulum inexpectatum]|uniref:AraC-like DNA-binding protein n=1 Tax=Albidovulum inexpectatum TaxID=196587 RepID=A0A2S5JMH2_9RHOB|nr:AraC family transcriptional regulator [Albidovulum inexpectatum]PPB82601.1 AraC-like DNA-binding protein [Albidovulum inexpectatum]